MLLGIWPEGPIDIAKNQVIQSRLRLSPMEADLVVKPEWTVTLKNWKYPPAVDTGDWPTIWWERAFLQMVGSSTPIQTSWCNEENPYKVVKAYKADGTDRNKTYKIPTTLRYGDGLVQEAWIRQEAVRLPVSNKTRVKKQHYQHQLHPQPQLTPQITPALVNQ